MKMLRNRIIKDVANKLNSYNISSVRNSALFINGPKATENFVYVTPHVDYPERIKNRHLIQEDLIKRKINFDLNKLENLWLMYEELKKQKTEYHKKKEEISRELGNLMKNEPKNDTIKKLKIQIDLIKENIKKLKVPLWSAEEAAMIEALKLPNVLHPRTPSESGNKVLHLHLSRPTNKKDHLQIGRDLDLINFKNNVNYYLKGDAAVFELGAKFYFSKIFKNHKYIQFSNPDFVKSVIVEGCGLDHTSSDSTFILHHNEDTKVNIDSRLHLTGGGSIHSFMAYYAKNVLYSKVLPLKLFSLGRQYVPSPTAEDSLFHVSQASVIQVFGSARNSQELDGMLDELVQNLKLAYGQLNYHFRISLVPAHKLAVWESLRVSVEMYSTSLESYVEIANISLSGDFISKRLMFTYMHNKSSEFPHLLSGTFLNVPKFLACALEQDETFDLPKQFNVESWTV